MRISKRPLRGINPAARAIKCGIDWLRDETDAGNIPCVRDTFGRRLFDDHGIAVARALYRARRLRAVGRRN
jgi:hypothetical protein